MTTGSQVSCENCGVGHGPDDIFCENCGYDFITGSLPGPNEQFPAPPETAEERFGGALFPAQPPSVVGPVGTAAASVSVRVEVSIDQGYFEAVVSEGELTFPDEPPAPVVLDLQGPEIHIGRTSQSRAIHPEIDVAALTGDPAVSSRHAVIRGDSTGALNVTDIGSTNGTYVTDYHGSGIGVGRPAPLASGADLYVGAWTRLRVTTVAAQPPMPPPSAPTPPMPPKAG